jgi:hypothetical protein
MLKEISLDELLGLVLIGATKEFYTRCIINGHDILEGTLLKDNNLHMWEQSASEYDPWVMGVDNVTKALKSMINTPSEYISSDATEFKGFYVLCN